MTGRTPDMPVIFGEVLFDRFPDGSVVLGGAPFNVAWNLQALGLAPLLISRIGQDEMGERILSAMEEWSLEQAGVQRDPVHPTGTVEVSFEEGEPAFAIPPDRAYDFIAADELVACGAEQLLYHGSLALRNADSRQALAHLRETVADQVLMDVNLRAPWWSRTLVTDLMAAATWLKLNEDELASLVPGDSGPEGRALRLLDQIPVEGLIVTRGPRGSFLQGRGGLAHAPEPVPAPRVVDTVGAGDAFSSVMILGLVRNWPWPLILTRAQTFAAAVVGLRGATTRDRTFYRSFVQQWENS